MRFRLDRLTLCLLTLTALAPAARAGDTEPGTYWEQTVEMQMGGMKMPAQTQKVCVSKKGMEEPPRPGGKEDKDCEIYDVKHDGPKMTWKMKCTGKTAMTGEGEILSRKDGYDGQLSMHMDQGDMNMKMRGKLVGGDCDAAAIKKQVAAIQKQAKQQQADGDRQMDEMCEKAADEMSMRMFSGPVVTCKKPEQVAKLCGKLGTRAGYGAYRRQARQDPEAAGIAKKLCKKDPDDGLPKLCAQAVKETSGDTTPSDVLAFLGDNCPDEARVVAKKECAGRKFTGLPEGMRRVCLKYAKDELGKSKTRAASDEDTGEDEGDEAPPPKKEPKDKAMDAGKKLLKGLW